MALQHFERQAHGGRDGEQRLALASVYAYGTGPTATNPVSLPAATNGSTSVPASTEAAGASSAVRSARSATIAASS